MLPLPADQLSRVAPSYLLLLLQFRGPSGMVNKFPRALRTEPGRGNGATERPLRVLRPDPGAQIELGPAVRHRRVARSVNLFVQIEPVPVLVAGRRWGEIVYKIEQNETDRYIVAVS